MTRHAIVLCEGAHDQAIVAALAERLDGWQAVRKVPKELPPRLDRLYPRPQENKWGAPEFDPPPRYLQMGDRWIEIRQLGGTGRLLGKNSAEFLQRAKPDAVAVIVDANSAGVDSRVQQARTRFAPLYSHVADIRAGEICPGVPPVGLWVAPDNKNDGTLLDPMLAITSKVKPKLTRTAERFVTSSEKLEPGDWTKHRAKATLGAAGQTVAPGGSLAVALKECTWIAESDFGPGAPFQPLMDFLRDITKG